MKKTDQRTRLTKILIRKSLTTLLSEKPIERIPIKELCDHAGINRGTFYAHYADIYDLLEQIEKEMKEDFKEALKPLLDQNDKSLTPLKITAGIFECIRENADLCIVTLGPNGDKKFAKELLDLGRERCLASYTKHFAEASPSDIEYYYAFVSSGCIGLLEKWLGDGMVMSSEDLARIAERIMLSGICFLKGENPMQGLL